MFKTKLIIEGMSCGMCEAHVNDTVRKSFKVKKVVSSHAKGKTEIISSEPLDVENLERLIEETGYKVVGIEMEEYEKRGFSLFKKFFYISVRLC